MNDDFVKALFANAVEDPSLQQAIMNLMGKSGTEKKGYTIPTRLKSKYTDEVEDIHTYYLDMQDMIDDEDKKEQLVQVIKTADSMTVENLARRLNCLWVALTAKEAKGEELTDLEKTIRDLDISALTLIILSMYLKYFAPTHEEPIKEE